MMLIIMTAVNGAELYMPLFLQNLHQVGPLVAGYLASLMSIGWTCGSLPSAGISARKLPYVLILSPLLCFCGTAVLFFMIPGTWSSGYFFSLITVALFIIGFGTGIIWPHLLTRILQYASHEDADLASASLTTIQLFGTALSAALAGTMTNLAGLTNPGGIVGTTHAATALFAFMIILLVCVVPLARRVICAIRQESDM